MQRAAHGAPERFSVLADQLAIVTQTYQSPRWCLMCIAASKRG
jgi:hypothetical protein